MMANSHTWSYAAKSSVLLLLSLISPLVHCQSSDDALIADGYSGFSDCSIYKCLVPLYKKKCVGFADYTCACGDPDLLEADAQCIASRCSFDEAKQGYGIGSQNCVSLGGLGISRSDWMREAKAGQQGAGSSSPTPNAPIPQPSKTPQQHTSTSSALTSSSRSPTPSQGAGGTTSGSGSSSSGGSGGAGGGGGGGGGMSTGALVGIIVAAIGSAAGIATLWWTIYAHKAKERRKQQQERAQALNTRSQAELWHGGPVRGQYAPVYDMRDQQDQWRY